MNKDQDTLKEIAEEFKSLSEQMNIEVVTSSCVLNEIEYYLKENNMETIVAQCNKVMGSLLLRLYTDDYKRRCF